MSSKKSFEVANLSRVVAANGPSGDGPRGGSGGQVRDHRAREASRGTVGWSGTGTAGSAPLGFATREIHATVERLIDLVVSLAMAGGDVRSDSAPEPWVSIQRAAEYADCSADTVLRAMKREELRYGKVGSDYRTRLSWVDTWMMSQPSHSKEKRAASSDPERLAAGTVRMLGALAKEEK